MVATLLFLLFSWSCDALAIDTSSTRSSATTTTSTNKHQQSSSSIIYKSRDYHLLEIVPHSTTSFTQGLTLSPSSNLLYEGTGLKHQSQILQHDPTQNMKTLEKRKVQPGHLFGEGITYYYVDKQLDDNSEGGEVVREHRLIQLTWKDKIGMIYRIHTNNNKDDDTTSEEDNGSGGQSAADAESLELIDTFKFNTHTGEGWGITFVPHTKEFYVSDGSEYIHVWDVETLEEKRRMAVTLERQGGSGGGGSSSVRLKYVNELEFVEFRSKNECGGAVRDWDIHDVYLEQCQEGDGEYEQTTCSSVTSESDTAGECNNDENNTRFTSTMSILANVWYQDVLIRIDPVTAKIIRVYDLSDIYPYEQRKKDGADCLNGISVTGKDAEEEEGLELWVTGKLWPKMYRIRLID
jgi:glutamine cyclotransferase